MVVLNGRPEDREVHTAIEMTRLCRTLQVLPYSGGLYEQPWIVVEMMKMVINAENERERRDRERQQRGTVNA